MITSSGTLITLVFAVGAAAGGEPVEVAGPGRVALVLALATFIGAALAGIVVSWTWKTSAMPTDAPNGLRDFVDEAVFTGPAQAVDRRIAEAHLNQVRTLRKINGIKAVALQVGLALEVVAIVCVAVVVGVTVA